MNICIWPDGEWCREEEVEERLMPPMAKSDDYETVNVECDVESHIDAFVRGYLIIQKGELA